MISRLKAPVLAAAAVLVPLISSAEGAARPNIIYLMLDEWGCFEWSATGHPILQTHRPGRAT